jgi:hypothetical protein
MRPGQHVQQPVTLTARGTAIPMRGMNVGGAGRSAAAGSGGRHK